MLSSTKSRNAGKTFLLWSVSIAFLVFTSLLPTYSQTIIPGGHVSGTWNVAGSPYLIMGDITVGTDSTLTIEPGVEVNFQGYYSFTVNGYLQAVGTEADSIHFFPANTTNGWNTMHFENAPDSSHLAYCTISYSGNNIFGMGGIICTNSNPVITHCRISDNRARSSVPGIAGGIVLNSSHAEISWCDISNNGKPDYGGGIYISHSSPVITGCNISGNESVMYGGGIYITGTSSPIITSCTIEGNVSNWEGGGIYCAGGVTNFLDCTIGYNESYLSGGGINSATGNMSLNRCTIERNQCSNWSAQGGGIFANGGTLTVDHCTFYGNYIENYGNYGMDIHTGGSVTMTVSNSIFYNDDNLIVFGSTSPASVSYSDFQSTYGPYFTGNIPAGLGQLTTTNANGDSCDVYYNIFLDPLFENPGSGNYQITWANWPNPDSTKSPCIDAGDPLSPLDPDGTITDMGVFSFDQSIPVELVSFTAELNENNVVLKWITATENNNNGFEIQRKLDNPYWEKIGFVEGHGTTTEIQEYSYTDDISNIKGNSVTYRLKQIDFNGSFEYSKEVLVEIVTPLDFALYQNYPNPFNPSTKIKFSIPYVGTSLMKFVQLKVYDILGNEVATLVNEYKPAGSYEINFDARGLTSGIYFYQLKADSFVETRKMILMK